jgi:hypothetical protein
MKDQLEPFFRATKELESNLDLKNGAQKTSYNSL